MLSLIKLKRVKIQNLTFWVYSNFKAKNLKEKINKSAIHVNKEQVKLVK